MLEILTGLISGTVSGTGMGGGTILILILSVFMGVTTYSTSHKSCVFCANITFGNCYNNKR